MPSEIHGDMTRCHFVISKIYFKGKTYDKIVLVLRGLYFVEAVLVFICTKLVLVSNSLGVGRYNTQINHN